jgi:hypothetical protein
VRTKEKVMLAGLFLILIVGLGGCAAAYLAGAGGAVGVAYLRGEDRRVFAYNFDEVYDATLAAITEDCKLPVYEEMREAANGTIKASLAKGTKVQVQVKFLSAGATEVRIRVGAFGDEDFSNMLFYRIEDRLRGIEPPARIF